MNLDLRTNERLLELFSSFSLSILWQLVFVNFQKDSKARQLPFCFIDYFNKNPLINDNKRQLKSAMHAKQNFTLCIMYKRRDDFLNENKTSKSFI